MPINIPRRGDRRPIDLRVPLQYLFREPPGRLSDDLKCPNYCVNGFSVRTKSVKIEFGAKGTDRIDVVRNIGQSLAGILRRHARRRAGCSP